MQGEVQADAWIWEATRWETLMLVFLVDRAQSTVNRKGAPEARDIGKHILEYRYIIFGPELETRDGSKNARSLYLQFFSNNKIDTFVVMTQM